MDEYKRRRIEERTKAICETFSKEYIRGYKDALIAKIKDEFNKKPKPDWQLLTAPVPTEPIKTGFLVKQGGTIKNWKKRWFKVFPDYSIEYYEKENGKKKGEINLDGYTVIEEGMKGKNFSIEMRHKKRRCWFIQCQNEDDKKMWIDVFKMCCKKASRSTSNKDKVMAHAFKRAYERTRWSLYLWGWYTYSGSEGERLGDLIIEELERDVLSDIWQGLSGTPKMQEITRNTIMKTVEGVVGAAVEAAWKAICSAIDEVKKPIEDAVRKVVEPIFAKEKELKEKIKETIMGTVDPALQQIVVPPLAKVLDVLMKPIRESYGELFKSWLKLGEIFQKIVAEHGADEKGIKKWMYESYWEVRYYWGPMRNVIDKVEEIAKPLDLLGEVVSYVRSWRITSKIIDRQRKLLTNACYTVTVDLGETKDPRAAIRKTAERLLHDCQIQILNEYFSILKAVVMPPFNQEIIPKVVKLIEPLDSLIPDALKDLINPLKTLDELLTDLVETMVRNCVDQAAKDDPARLAESFSQLSL